MFRVGERSLMFKPRISVQEIECEVYKIRFRRFRLYNIFILGTIQEARHIPVQFPGLIHRKHNGGTGTLPYLKITPELNPKSTIICLDIKILEAVSGF